MRMHRTALWSNKFTLNENGFNFTGRWVSSLINSINFSENFGVRIQINSEKERSPINPENGVMVRKSVNGQKRRRKKRISEGGNDEK